MSSPTTWPGRSHVSTFVHTLHLLDLDQLEDWPNVSIQLFDPKSNLQHRLRCVEWSLYRLFEFYDVKTTRDKLRPFFPPATTLQSVNLRAALLRQLTDLKKDGLLGGSVLLRKTMLDECKGDKFEELLATFSIIVLRKVLVKSNNRHIVTSSKLSHTVPLVLSHRKAIQRDLEKRKELDLRTKQQQHNIDASIHALSDELVVWTNRKAPALPRNADTLRRLVRENWIGDTEWVDTILHGVPPTPGFNYDDVEDENEVDAASLLLIDLDTRVQGQNARLVHWQQYVTSLQQQGCWTESSSARVKRSITSTTPRRFAQHHEITLQAGYNQDSVVDFELNPRHAALLEILDQGRSKQAPESSTLSFNFTQASNQSSPYATRPGMRSGSMLASSQRSPVRRRKTSDASSQDTIVAHSNNGPETSLRASKYTISDNFNTSVGRPIFGEASIIRGALVSTSPELDEQMSLAERTRASLAQFETPRAKLWRSKTTVSPDRDAANSTVVTASSNLPSDRTSLLERTRQSMSFLANVLDDNYQPLSGNKQKKARHSKSKSMHIPAQKHRLERAWSEESLASAAKEDSFDVEADYESVFKSRPRLAMSPNLSPARSHVPLDGDLEDALNKLTINSSSPEY